MTRRFFGTDGIRGVANEFLTAELALAAGRAIAAVLPSPSPRIIIGRDTRISGPMLEAALVAGISSAGGAAELAGVVPTPAVASLVLGEGADAGAVISASHNPYRDNGIKFFGSDGFKLTDRQEAEIERLMEDEHARGLEQTDPGAVSSLTDAPGTYVDTLLADFDLDLSGMRIMLDCANGATYRTSPMAFRRLGADVTVICDQPDGFNINRDCGSNDTARLQEAVTEGGFDLGFAFDGDGDRVIAVDPAGAIVDGDFIMAICAGYLREKGMLPHDTIVTTVMTNLGFHLAMRELGIAVRTTDVGDRYVLEEMRAGGFVLGGEQSGHIINLDTGSTGDGLATSLLLLKAVGDSGARLDELLKVMRRLPQKLVNVKVADKDALEDADAVWDTVEEQSALLDDEGRILVRPSGTEPVVRVMVEAPTAERCHDVCDSIVAVVKKTLG
jgi:phosphoglucosamine mutase